MRALVAFPMPAKYSNQVALAFEERKMLTAFFTTFAYHKESDLSEIIDLLPHSLGHRIATELSRRSVDELRLNSVETRPLREMLRTFAAKAGMSDVVVDQVWDWGMRDFTRAAGRRLRKQDVDVLYAYEYSALEAFHEAKKLGIARILDFPSLNSRQFELLQQEQRARFPELRGENDAYFVNRFEERQARRDAEMELADIIITNSSVTRASHIRAGAPADRTFVVNLAAPPTIASIAPRPLDGPLRVIWAGAFSIRKGAHLFLQALDALPAGDVQVDIYGPLKLPRRMMLKDRKNITFHGSVVQSTLFSAFQSADVLVFPTLSDGFGMVVSEAMSRGLPVISTDMAGASDLVREGENGLIIPAGDDAALLQALTWCLNNRAPLFEMREVALATAKNYQWHDYRKQFIDTVTKGLGHVGIATS
jgi:glycosyltransferase involved in cell wall biosynthesis